MGYKGKVCDKAAPDFASKLTALDAEAARIVAKYDQKGAATLTLLHLAQDACGYVTPQIEQWVAKWAEVTPVHVHGVVTFYSMYHQAPVGRNHIRFCTTTSCVLNGSEDLLGHVKKKLGIQNGGVTADGKFSLEESECLCACEQAPVMQVGDDYHSQLTVKKIDQILDGLR